MFRWGSVSDRPFSSTGHLRTGLRPVPTDIVPFVSLDPSGEDGPYRRLTWFNLNILYTGLTNAYNRNRYLT